MWLIPSPGQWKGWSLPSRLTAIGALVGVLSLALYLAEKSLGIFGSLSRPVVSEPVATGVIALTLENPTDAPIGILRKGDFVLWLPQGVDGVRRLPGKYDLKVSKAPSPVLVVVIGPRAAVPVLARLSAEIPLGQLLDRGVADLELILRKERGGILFSGAIPFTQDAMTTTRWKIDLARKE